MSKRAGDDVQGLQNDVDSKKAKVDLDQQYLSLALRLAREAGELLRKNFYTRNKRKKTKSSPVDVVTETDAQCEEIILAGIRETFPDHVIIAEESHAEDGVYHIDDRPTWCVDPIDGTANFLHSLPFTCVSIGLMVGQKPRVGVVHFPMLNETFTGVAGKGAFLNQGAPEERKLEVTDIDCLSEAAVLSEFGNDRSPEGVAGIINRLHKVALAPTQTVRMFGSCAYNMCCVAFGRADAYFEMGTCPAFGPKPWDTLAAHVIVLEAGGVVTSTTGEAFNVSNGRVLAAATPKLAEELASKIREALQEVNDQKKK